MPWQGFFSLCKKFLFYFVLIVESEICFDSKKHFYVRSYGASCIYVDQHSTLTHKLHSQCVFDYYIIVCKVRNEKFYEKLKRVSKHAVFSSTYLLFTASSNSKNGMRKYKQSHIGLEFEHTSIHSPINIRNWNLKRRWFLYSNSFIGKSAPFTLIGNGRMNDLIVE